MYDKTPVKQVTFATSRIAKPTNLWSLPTLIALSLGTHLAGYFYFPNAILAKPENTATNTAARTIAPRIGCKSFLMRQPYFLIMIRLMTTVRMRIAYPESEWMIYIPK